MSRTSSIGNVRCRDKFLRVFPAGFYDQKYLDWERGYKWTAHRRWDEFLNKEAYLALLRREEFNAIAAYAIKVESRTNLLFSFEKMALRDAVRSPGATRVFALGLYDFLYRSGAEAEKFDRWCEAIGSLPRRQTRVLTWPLLTIFGFIALPREHMFLKPNVTRTAAREYGFDFAYRSKPSWDTYTSLLQFARTVRRDLRDLRPRDMIDIQSFLWVQGSAEYEE